MAYINRKGKGKYDTEEPKIVRAKLPRNGESIGVVEQRLGGNKMMVNCVDGKSRICRVPGRMKRKLWLRPDDIVIVEPWELDPMKADVIYKYRPAQIAWLRKNGHLEEENDEF